MSTLNTESVVTTLVEVLLPRGGSVIGYGDHPFLRYDPSKPSKALYVSLHFRLDTYNGDSDHERRVVHLIFERPTNYTKVWSAVGGYGIPQPEEFTMRSDHDSCWRSDGLRDISVAYLDMLRKLRERNPGEQISEYCTVQAVAWLEVVYEPDFDDRPDGYRKRLTSIKQMEDLTHR